LYHSIVGDDWTIAASITIGIAVTFCWLVQSNIQVWWLLASCANRMAALSSFRGLAYAVVQLNRSALVLSIGNGDVTGMSGICRVAPSGAGTAPSRIALLPTLCP